MVVTVGIAGITGKFASLLATTLLKSPEAFIRGIARTPSKATPAISSSSRVTIIQGGAFDKEAIRAFVQGCDVVICGYLGDDELMVEGQKLLIDACEEAGVPRYASGDWTLDYT